ncbi:hypothetical protein [Luteibacter sp. W1I16]|uniref:hypothetical protein n=1 Tax=Luteibacter sp. W1I16 TaxID=3373922 RepID=UPI003D25DC63
MLFIAFALASSQGVTMSAKDGPKALPHEVAASMDCGAFKKNADGSWTSIHATKVAAVTMSAGGTFFRGVRLDGVDVGASLDTKCAPGRDKAAGAGK